MTEKNIDLSKIKELIEKEDISIDSAFKQFLKSKRSEIFINNVIMAETFIKCCSLLNSCFLNKKDCEEIKITLDLASFHNVSLSLMFEDYGKGKDYGDWVVEDRIKRYVSKNKKEIEKLINNFYYLFIEES